MEKSFILLRISIPSRSKITDIRYFKDSLNSDFIFLVKKVELSGFNVGLELR